jgi:Ca2+-binding EF-hand superfamily protein
VLPPKVKQQKPAFINENKALKLKLYVWSKMYDQGKNVGQTFRIFDSKNRGRLSKKDFMDGLERFTIGLSRDDFNCLWTDLDQQSKGYLVFEDFSRLPQSEQQ